LLVVGIEDCGDYVKLVSQIVAHEDESQVERETYNIFNTSGKGAQRLQEFMEATEVLTRNEIVEAHAAGQFDLEPDYEKAVGKTYFGKLETSEWNGKERCKVEFGFFHPDNPIVADWPRHEGLAPLPKPEAANEETVPQNEKEACPF